MPQYRRPKIPCATVFFTVNLADRRSDLLIARIDELRKAVRLTRATRQFEIVAWVVLPDHMHSVWTLPNGDDDYSSRWKEIKYRFTRAVGGTHKRSASMIAKGERGVWQRRFWDHHIRNSRDYQNHVQYCWFNPVKHGYVDRPAAWPYSSIHWEIRLGNVAPEWSADVPDGNYGE